MKKIILYLAFVVGLSTLNAYAGSVCSNSFAMLQCNIGTIESLDYLGMVDLDGTTVLGTFDVIGNVEVADAHLNWVNIKGSAHIIKTSVASSFKIVGNLHANEVEMHGPIKIEGNLFANHLTLSAPVDIMGVAYCESCVFQRDIKLIGSITAINSEFIGLMTLNTKKSEFNHTRLGDVVVDKPSDDVSQTIHLRNGSTLHNLTFANQKGIVILESGSKITGALQGGKVVAQ